MFDKTDQLAVNTIRTLSIDQIEKAGAGHPGLPMGAAPMAYVLWTKHYKYNPNNPKWFNRDRFILSAGHGSAMLYSLLHLSGLDVSIEELKHFRSLKSKTPGHPETHITEGVEATTGPLGQGIANSVGMAMAEEHIASLYNKEDYNLTDHYTYVLCGDGDLQEGISYEAASLAGHLKLGKLIILFDSNDVQLDGDLNKTFSENIQQRFESFQWDYSKVEDGNDLDEIDKAITRAKNVSDKPSIIEIKTEIGYGSPTAGTSAMHSDPIGDEAVKTTKDFYKWDYNDFEVPQEVYDRFDDTLGANNATEQEWNQLLEDYKRDFPELSDEITNVINGKLPEDWEESLPSYESDSKGYATRNISSELLNKIAKVVPNFWGGSADLASSNKTMIDGAKDFLPGQYEGKNIWFGVREFAMTAINNGILLHGGTFPYIGTFFVFSDYARPAIRLAALSKLPAIYVFTHDSIAVGFDGATHEPIEQLASYRAMPNITLFRPADANESVAAWKHALNSEDHPTILALSRQALPVLENSEELAPEGVEKGAYTISPAKDKAEGLLLAAGSEVAIAVETQKRLLEKGHDVSVVSFPSFDLFDKQSKEYKESVLPKEVKNRLSIEMGATFGWDRYVGLDGEIFGIDRFGESGSGDDVIKYFGFTVDNVVDRYLSMVE
ncbi:MAG: transketolase [Tetragenococcus halophilus]|nr:transketolase [Tetragenococcus halophilus]